MHGFNKDIFIILSVRFALGELSAKGGEGKGAVLARMLMSDWQVIFLQSKANGGAYDGERFPGQKWDWPRSTWFQNRLRYLRKSQQPVVLRKTTTGLELA